MMIDTELLPALKAISGMPEGLVDDDGQAEQVAEWWHRARDAAGQRK